MQLKHPAIDYQTFRKIKSYKSRSRVFGEDFCRVYILRAYETWLRKLLSKFSDPFPRLIMTPTLAAAT